MNLETNKVKHKNNFCAISVIMPVHNAEKFVSEAISSILNQTFADFEFIIIDDGSTDNSWDIIQSFADDRIIAVRNAANRGTYPSRNIGIRLMKGKYMAVMDADDIALPDRLRIQFDCMKNNPDVLATGTQYTLLGTDRISEKPVLHAEIQAALLNDSCMLHPSLLVRSDVIKRLSGYDEQYIYASDYDLICRLSLMGRIENLPDICMLYRWHPDQISQAKRLEQKGYANIIRQKYQIAFINRHKSPQLPEVGEAETGHARIGQVIGLYIMGDCFGQTFRNQAEYLLNHVLENVHPAMPMCTGNGLLGIGSGIIYLLRNHFVKGDEDGILENLDDTVFDAVVNFKEDQNFDWEGIRYYLRKRALMPERKKMSARLKIRKMTHHFLTITKRYDSHDREVFSHDELMRIFEDPLPRKVRIDASTLCQLACKSCYMRKCNYGTMGRGYLKFSDFEKFIQNNPFVKIIELSNSGEIFLNPDLFQIIKYAFENNIELHASNGVNLNQVSDEMLEALVRYNFRFITISIDGASQETYSLYRVNGDFDTVIDNIKKLNVFKQKYNSPFPVLQWQYILMEHNENDVVKAKAMAEELKIRIFFKLTWDTEYVPTNVEMLKKETGLTFLTREEVFRNEGRVYLHTICVK